MKYEKKDERTSPVVQVQSVLVEDSSRRRRTSFGEGKSYSTFSVACAGALAPGEPVVHIACNVSNTAGPDGDEEEDIFTAAWPRSCTQALARTLEAR